MNFSGEDILVGNMWLWKHLKTIRNDPKETKTWKLLQFFGIYCQMRFL